MALTTQQIANLNSLNQKISGGYQATSTDLANLDYAKKQGYSYNPVPTGATKILNPAGLQGLTESQIFRSGQDIYKLPSAISSDMITGSTAPTIKPVEPSFTDTAPYVAGLDTTTKGLESLVSTALAPTPQEKNISPITSKITELTGEFQNKPVDYQAELDKYGFKTNVQDLQNLNTQIASVKAQYDKISEQNANLPISSRIIGGTQDRLARQSAIELGGLSSMAQALQGNVQMAQNIADKTIAIKYEPVEQEIANQKFQLEQVYEQLSRDEKKKADALKITLDERLRKIEEEKEKETNISNVMLAAAQAGADSGTLQQIMKATDYMSAIQLASKYLDKTETTWEESEVLDANGNPMLFNTSTGEYKTAVGTSTSDIFFTDANGDSWNIAGWATDQTKPQQMNAIAKRIGKVTDENIDEKVKEFTPGLTANMIKEASAMSGVSWEAIMTMVNQESQGGMSNVAKNNNNFGGLTFNNQEWIKEFGGEKGTARPTAEGGNYIKFPTKQDGLNAMAALMASYGKVDTTPKVADEVYDLTKLVEDGKLTDKEALAQVSDRNKQNLINSLSSVVSVSDTANDIVAKEKAQLATDLINHKGLGSAVGVVGAGRVPAPWNIGKKQDFIASVEQLVSGLSLDSLVEAKSRGATFGALSDTEMRILASAATKIGTWRNLDKNGNVTGYKASESAFKKELENINKILLRGVKSNIESGESDPLGLGISNSTNPLGI